MANGKWQIDPRVCGLIGLIGLAALAVAVRVAAVFAVGSYKLERVTYEHGEIARNLVEGRGFVVRWLGAEGPTSQQAPVYPGLVAAFYWLIGVQTPAALLACELFQAALGGLLATSVVGLMRELLPDRPAVGWLAGLGAALYPTLVYAATQVQVASLARVLVGAVLWTAARAARRQSIAAATACGGIGGLLVLTDPILGLVVAVALLVIARGRRPATDISGAPKANSSGRPAGGSTVRSTRDSVLSTQYWPPISFGQPMAPAKRVAVAVAACLAVVAPWTVRNYRVHGELVPVKSTFGYAFWQGNHPRSFGTDKIPVATASSQAAAERGPGIQGLEQALWHARLIDTLYIDDAVLSDERIAELGRFAEPERSRQLLAESVAYIQEHPRHYLRLCVQRLRYFLLFDETNPKSRLLAYRLSHLALLALAVAGLGSSRHHARQLWPTYLVFALVTTFHTLTIVSARFHIPLEPIEIIWAACAVEPLVRAAATGVAAVRRGSVRPVSAVAAARQRV